MGDGADLVSPGSVGRVTELNVILVDCVLYFQKHLSIVVDVSQFPGIPWHSGDRGVDMHRLDIRLRLQLDHSRLYTRVRMMAIYPEGGRFTFRGQFVRELVCE